jgi:hypothetical protein
MEIIVLDYQLKKQELINRIMHKFNVDNGKQAVLKKQVDFFIDEILSPQSASFLLHLYKKEADQSVNGTIADLNKTIGQLRGQVESMSHKMSTNDNKVYDMDFVCKINRVIQQSGLVNNSFRGLIASYKDCNAPFLGRSDFYAALRIVSEVTKVSEEDILSRCRTLERYQSRKLLVLSILCFYNTTIVSLAKFLGRDHTTILHYIEDNKFKKYDSKKKKAKAL